MMSYKKEDVFEHVKKMKALFAGEMKDRILIHFCTPGSASVSQFFPDIPKMFDAEMHNHGKRSQFIDDFFPSGNPCFGNPYAGFMGGELRSDEHNAWSIPMQNIYNRLDEVRYNENNPWLAKFIYAMEYYKQHKPDNFLLSSPSTWGPDDIAEALRGPEILYDFYDRPEELKALLRHCADFVLQFRQRALEMTDKIDGGHVGWQGFWVPDNCLSLTMDTSSNYSAEMFEEFLLPVIDYTVDKAGGKYWIHLEGSSIHIADSLKKINGLLLLQYTNNPKLPRGIAVMDVLRSKFRDLSLKLLVTRQELYDGIREKTLIGNCIYDVGFDTENMNDYVRTPEEAEEIMQLSGEYRARI
jgi:hypothetical protein